MKANRGSAALIALSGATWLFAQGCARRTPAEADPSARVAVPKGAVATGTLDSRTRGWELGSWYAYALKLTTAVSFGDGANTLAFDVDGLVQITPTAVTPDIATLYLAIANPKITSRDPRSQSEFDKVAAEIGSTGCFFTLSGGRITEMRAPHGLAPTAANTYREIGAAFQFARTSPASDRYTAEEYDTTGQYVAEYEFDRDRDLWHKRKQRYLSILASKMAPSGAPGRVVPQIDRSEGDIHVLPNGRPEHVDLRNTVTVQGAQQPVHSTTTLSLQAGPPQPARQPAPDWTALISAMDRTGADEPYGAPASIESLDKARIGGITFDQAVAGLEQFAKGRQGAVESSVNGASLDADEKTKREQKTDEESRLFIALSAIFREQPETVARAVQKINAKSPASDLLVEALSGASSAAAQGALARLLASKGVSLAQRNRIMMALSRTPRPDAQSVETMRATLRADPFNEIALLGLGTYSRRLREAGSVDQANAIGELLIEQLKAAQNSSDRMTALRAITNSGYAPALAPVTAFLTDTSDTVRVAAVRALQSMNDPRVDGLLAERLQQDSSSDVRVSALSAAKVREPTGALAQAVEGAATTAADPHVRYRAVDLLATWIVLRPDVRSTLEKIAKNDGEVRIRERAQSAL